MSFRLPSTTPQRRKRFPRRRSAAAIVVTVIVALVGYFTQQHTSSSSPTSPQPTSRETTRSSGDNARTPSTPKSSTTTRDTTRAPAPKATSKAPAANLTLDDGGIAELFRKQESDTWIEATGRVERLLADDNDGERHQKFLMAVSDDITVLVSHNIDAAKRVPLKEGDYVRLRGEYEYSEKGGIVHFTHKPKFQRKAPGGWIEHNGTRYE